MILSVHVKQTFDKIQHQFMMKTLSKLGMKGKFLKLIIPYMHTQTANIILNGEKLESFPVTSEIRQGCLLSPLISTALEILIMLLNKKRKQKVYIWKRKK